MRHHDPERYLGGDIDHVPEIGHQHAAQYSSLEHEGAACGRARFLLEQDWRTGTDKGYDLGRRKNFRYNEGGYPLIPKHQSRLSPFIFSLTGGAYDHLCTGRTKIWVLEFCGRLHHAVSHLRTMVDLDLRTGDAKKEIAGKARMSTNGKKMMYRVNLNFSPGLTRSVFINARSRGIAEQRALKRYRGSKVVRSPFPQN